MAELPRVVSAKAAARFVGLSESTLAKLRLNGNGPAYCKLGRRVVYRPADLDEWLQSRVARDLPSICWFVDVAKAEGFLAYASDNADVLDRFARQVDQALKGVKVADIPAYQPTKFILAVNLRTAKSLGLQIPASLVAQADEVIE